MKIAVTTLYTPEIADFSEEAVKNFRMYCDLNGYDLFVYEQSLKEGLRGNWCKPKVLLNHINDYDYVVWLDSDIAILDINRKLEDIIEPHKDKTFIATDDMGGWKLNNGFMIFKNIKYVKEMLGALWKIQSQFINKDRGDQKFFIDFLERVKFSRQNYHLYPQSEICAPLLLKNDKSFSVHLMGIHINDVRKKYIKYINNKHMTKKTINLRTRENLPKNLPNITLPRDSDVENKLKLKQDEFIKLKNQWLNFFDNDRSGKHTKLFDWFKYISSQIPAIEEPEDRFNCFNPFKKIAIVSLYTKEISEFAVHSEKSIKDYCEKQGYSFYVYRESLDKNGSPNWSKSQALLNHINDHEYIVWMDSDTLIFNPEKRFESIIEKTPKKFVLATKDIGNNSILNSGVLIFKSHEYSKNLIKKWRDFNGDKSSLYASGGDQEILCDILRKSDGFGFNRKIFEMNEFNTDPRLVDNNTFILHFMAYPHELKKIFMSYWNQLEF